MEIWQADMNGRYTHPNDLNPAPLDPYFQGYGVQLTDAQGRYDFKTIKPGPYPTPIPGLSRTPHIHFQVTGRITRLATQMYFDGEPLNDPDQLLQCTRGKERLIVKLQPPTPNLEPNSLVADWDIVIPQG